MYKFYIFGRTINYNVYCMSTNGTVAFGSIYVCLYLVELQKQNGVVHPFVSPPIWNQHIR